MARSRAVRVYFALILSFACLALFAPPTAQLATAPLLLTKTNSTRAIAVESTTLLAEPFAPNGPVPFSPDNRTRVILFANNLTLLPGETAAAVTAIAEDGNHVLYPLTVERVDPMAGATDITAVTMRLHDDLGDAGDVLVGISIH